jgi:hypothetical protein
MRVGSGGDASNSNWLIPLGIGPTTRESSSWSSCSSSGQETKVSFHSISVLYIGRRVFCLVFGCGEILLERAVVDTPLGNAPSLRGAGQSNVTRNW